MFGISIQTPNLFNVFFYLFSFVYLVKGKKVMFSTFFHKSFVVFLYHFICFGVKNGSFLKCSPSALYGLNCFSGRELKIMVSAVCFPWLLQNMIRKRPLEIGFIATYVLRLFSEELLMYLSSWTFLLFSNLCKKWKP